MNKIEKEQKIMSLVEKLIALLESEKVHNSQNNIQYSKEKIEELTKTYRKGIEIRERHLKDLNDPNSKYYKSMLNTGKTIPEVRTRQQNEITLYEKRIAHKFKRMLVFEV